MSGKAKYKKEAATLPSIDDDKAKFYTSKAPRVENDTSDQFPISKDFSSNGISSDGLHFKSKSQLNAEMQDRLSLLYKEGIEKQAKEVEDNTKKTRLSEVVEFDENIPSTNMSFFDRLLHQITRPSVSVADYLNDDVFTEIDESEVRTTVNDNTEIDKNESKDNSSFMNNIRSFIDAVNEETNVIRGIVDEDEFINQQSLKAKSSLPSTDDDQITSF